MYILHFTFALKKYFIEIWISKIEKGKIVDFFVKKLIV